MKVTAHILRNQKLEGWRERIVRRWTYRQLAANPYWYHGWISFDSVAFNPGDGKINVVENDNRERSSYLWSVELD
jgi:hypothetical protein